MLCVCVFGLILCISILNVMPRYIRKQLIVVRIAHLKATQVYLHYMYLLLSIWELGFQLIITAMSYLPPYGYARN